MPFKSERIKEAILRAAKAAGVDDADYCATVAEVVSSQMNARSQVDINEIQTAVENQLMSGPYKQLARAYIEYRHDRDIQREKRGRLNQEIRGLVEQTNSALLNENANKDSKVIPTQRDLLAGIVAKHYARQHLLPRDVVQAHERGDIHYHDLDYSPFFPMFNCMLIDLKGMLTQALRWVTPRSNRQNLSLPPLPLPRRLSLRSPAIFMAAPPLTGLMKCWHRLSPKAITSTAKPPMSGRSRMPKDMRVLAPKKSATTPSSRWSTKLTRCTPLTARRLS
ncbi:anaerobic ribonucleoside triphosphate reductase [Salmonella enterica subsp. enterica serovar Saintpaul str. S-70]|nr:anaerobic ribonucleoside triphosphate reductase [Salmonella enterica subsp. enterica serovar Saintpaul str. S-70]